MFFPVMSTDRMLLLYLVLGSYFKGFIVQKEMISLTKTPGV